MLTAIETLYEAVDRASYILGPLDAEGSASESTHHHINGGAAGTHHHRSKSSGGTSSGAASGDGGGFYSSAAPNSTVNLGSTGSHGVSGQSSSTGGVWSSSDDK